MHTKIIITILFLLSLCLTSCGNTYDYIPNSQIDVIDDGGASGGNNGGDTGGDTDDVTPEYIDDTAFIVPEYNHLATSISNLQSMISSASSGDVIALKNGIYSGVDLNISTSGITVVAETAGSVFIEGVSTIELTGDNIILEGFYFRNGYPRDEKGAILVSGDNNRVTNCTIDGFNDTIWNAQYKWLSLNNGTVFNEVDHNTFKGKRSEGTILVVWRDDNSRQDHHIHRNLFLDFEYVESEDYYDVDTKDGPDSNGWEVIRIGTSTQSQSSSYTTVEYNYFEDCNGEVEVISNKSGHNIYRYNTFINNKGMLTIRHGNSCTIDSNYFDGGEVSGSGGVRIIDKDHTVTNNYITNVYGTGNTRGGISISSHVTNASNSSYWEVKNAYIANNTIINAKQSFNYGSSEKENAPTSATIKDNLVINDGSYSLIEIQTSDDTNLPLDIVNPTYSGNIYYGDSLGLISVPSGINYSSSVRPVINQIESGQWIHEDVGASPIYRLTSSDVGASY